MGSDNKQWYGVNDDKSLSPCHAKDRAHCRYHKGGVHKQYTQAEHDAYMEAFNEIHATKAGSLHKTRKQREADAEEAKYQSAIDSVVKNNEVALDEMTNLITTGDYDNESLYSAFNRVNDSFVTNHDDYRRDEGKVQGDRAWRLLSDNLDIEEDHGEEALDLVEGNYGRRWLGMRFATMLAERDDLTESLTQKLINYDMNNPKSNKDLTKTLIKKTGTNNNLNIHINDLTSKTWNGKRTGEINDMERYALKHVNWDYDELKVAYGPMLWRNHDTRPAALKATVRECPKNVVKSTYTQMFDDTVKLSRDRKESLQGKLQGYRDNVAYISNLDYLADADLAVEWSKTHRDTASWGEFKDDVASRCANNLPVSPLVIKAAGYGSYDEALEADSRNTLSFLQDKNYDE
jgi:hypothetical protein